MIQYGDNGPGIGPELIVNSTHEGHFTWQSPPQVLFNSGPVSVELRVEANGDTTLTVASGSATGIASDSSIATGFITGVQVGAHVIAVPKRRLNWSSLVAKYYKAGVLRETVLMPAECEPQANTYPPVNQAFRAASYNPSATDNDAVTVTGLIQMVGDRGDPNFEFGPSDFLARVLVYSSSCQPR